MKVAITAILALAGAATVAANDFPANMPECGVSSSFFNSLLCGFLLATSAAHRT